MGEHRGLPAAVWQDMSHLGLLDLGIPTKHGGSVWSERGAAIVREKLERARSNLSHGVLPTAGFRGCANSYSGTDRQRVGMLPRIATGQLRLAIGLTEPDAGPDLAGLKTAPRGAVCQRLCRQRTQDLLDPHGHRQVPGRPRANRARPGHQGRTVVTAGPNPPVSAPPRSTRFRAATPAPAVFCSTTSRSRRRTFSATKTATCGDWTLPQRHLHRGKSSGRRLRREAHQITIGYAKAVGAVPPPDPRVPSRVPHD